MILLSAEKAQVSASISSCTICLITVSLTVDQSALHDNSIIQDDDPQASTDPFQLPDEVYFTKVDYCSFLNDLK